MICTNASCKNHGHDQPQSRFCPECGGALAEAPKPPVQPAASLPPGYNFPAIGKSIVGGDQNISNTSIYHQDETKSVRKCAVSGRQAEVTRGYVCPSCSLWVHEDHFDRVLMRCESCRLAASNHAQKQFEEKVTYFLSDGQISREELMELRTLGAQVGLSIPDQDNVIARLKKQLVRSESKGLSILDKTKLKSVLRQLTLQQTWLSVEQLDGVKRTLKVLQHSYPDNLEIATLTVVGLAQAFQRRGSFAMYRELEDLLQGSEALRADCPQKYLVQAIYYRLAGRMSAECKDEGVSDFLAQVTEKHHYAITQLESLYSESVECRASQIAALIEDYYANGGESPQKAEIHEFVLAATDGLGSNELEQALKMVRFNCDEGREFGLLRTIEFELKPLSQLYYSALFANINAAEAEVLFQEAENVVDLRAVYRLMLYRLAAEKGHAGAQYNVGFIYDSAKGVPEDYAEAIKWYRKAAEQGYAQAQDNLGNCYYHGKCVPQDYAEAVKWYRKAAEQGYAQAQRNLGNCYYHGKCVPQDYAEAVKWVRKAAEQGYAQAQDNLGNCYYHGKCVPQDYAEAVKWYRKAAEQGYAQAQNNLGNCYGSGAGVPQDYAKAVEWYRKAAEQGYAQAQDNLGDAFNNGDGVPQDYAEAVKWYRKAAEQGYAVAQNSLGLCYDNGKYVLQDSAEAVKWFRKAAEQGYAVAQNNLGMYYNNGAGVPQNSAEAVKWFRKASEQGYASSQYSLGTAFINGSGVVKDLDEAERWYAKAAEHGHVEAQNELISNFPKWKFQWLLKQAEEGSAGVQYQIGTAYHLGEGVVKDKEEAERWYAKAAEQGHVEAINVLKKFSPKWKFQWLLKQAESGSADAHFQIGNAYVLGRGIDKDKDKAFSWYTKAAELGHAEAKNHLHLF